MQESKPWLENYRLYTSREYEAELDLYYYRARYYDTKLWKFINRDPLLYIDGPNPYVYVNSNPVNYSDPWGLASEELLVNWHDVTELFKLYMKKSKEELSWWWVIQSRLIYGTKSLWTWEWNLRYNTLFIWENKEITQLIVDWKEVTPSELWNFYLWYNWYHAYFTLNSEYWDIYSDVYKAGMHVEFLNYAWDNAEGYWLDTEEKIKQRALADELADRPWYDAWYYYAQSENNWLYPQLRYAIEYAEANIDWNNIQYIKDEVCGNNIDCYINI